LKTLTQTKLNLSGSKDTRNKGKKKYTLITDIFRNPFSYLLLLPAALYTFIYGYMSLPWIAIAFQKYSFRTGIFKSEWVGLKNFKFFFASTNALTVTWNTVYLNILFLITGTVAAVLIAILMNEIKSKWFAKVTQSTLLFPHFISWVVVSYFVYLFFSMDEGFINLQVLKTLGIPAVNWYQTPLAWPAILTFIKLWKGTGIGVIIYLATISGFDSEVYEASTIDGCNRWMQIKCITIPMLAPIVTMMTLLSIGGIFKGDFGMMYTIIKDNGVLLPVTDVIDTYVFRALRKVGDVSNATAVGLYQSIVGFAFVYGSNWIAKKYFSEGALF